MTFEHEQHPAISTLNQIERIVKLGYSEALRHPLQAVAIEVKGLPDSSSPK